MEFLNQQQGRGPSYIPIITRDYSCKVKVDDVIYLEQRQRRLIIATETETYVFYERMENLAKFLDERFYRVLKKLTVNLEKILVAKDQSLIFQNGLCMGLARESYIRTKQTYVAYLRGLM